MEKEPSRRSARKPKKGAYDQTKPAARIINEKFEGMARFIEACAPHSQTCSYSPGTVYRWLQRGYFPPERIPEIKAAAAQAEIEISDSEFLA